MDKVVNVGPTWVYVKDIVCGVILALCIGTIVLMQFKLQAAENRAALAELKMAEAIIKLSDTFLNMELIK
jgi:uncharacterized membrane protein YraQ (UPF0718 family)